MSINLLSRALTVAACIFAPVAAQAAPLSIGAGPEEGVYYPTVSQLCQLLPRERGCEVVQTAGSVENLQQLSAGQLAFGIAQSDLVYQAYTGKGRFNDAAQKNLRAVMTIYPELLTLVAVKGQNINDLQDLRDKRVSLGATGSGTEATAQLLLEAAGISVGDLAANTPLAPAQALQAVKAGELDAYFYMVGHPAPSIERALQDERLQLVLLDGKPVYDLLEKYPYYSQGSIAAELYAGLHEDVPSLGVQAMLITTEKQPASDVEQLVGAVLAQFERFQASHPGYRTLKRANLGAPAAIPSYPGLQKLLMNDEF